MAEVSLEQDLFVSEKVYPDGRDSVSISRNTLDLNALISSARSPRSVASQLLRYCIATQSVSLLSPTAMYSAGAVSSFFGTTRDTFEGKDVTHLEYEAYPEMALASMLDICARVISYSELHSALVSLFRVLIPVLRLPF